MNPIARVLSRVTGHYERLRAHEGPHPLTDEAVEKIVAEMGRRRRPELICIFGEGEIVIRNGELGLHANANGLNGLAGLSNLADQIGLSGGGGIVMTTWDMGSSYATVGFPEENTLKAMEAILSRRKENGLLEVRHGGFCGPYPATRRYEVYPA